MEQTIEDGNFISVLMPNYNGEDFVALSIDSILAQTHQNFEIIIVDDCSTDRSWEIIQDYACRDERIKAFRNDVNLGVTKTRNRIFDQMGVGDGYFAILDSDDVAHPERLAKQWAYLQANQDVSGVGCQVLLIDEKGHSLGLRRYPTDRDRINEILLRVNPFAQSALMIRKNAILDAGRYDETLPRTSDHDLWIRMCNSGLQLMNLPEVLVDYRIHKSQGTQAMSRTHFWCGYQVRRRYLFGSDNFSMRNLLFTAGYLVLIYLPNSMRALVQKLWMKQQHNA